MKTILVLNMGMKSIRSIIFDSDGNKLASASRPITTTLSEDYVTQDPYEWCEKAEAVIKDTVSAVMRNIDYITVTASSSCLVYVDANGNPLCGGGSGGCLMVSDKRAKEESDFISECKAFPYVKERTGLRADSSLMLPKALWIKNHEPVIYSKVNKLLSPNDFLVSKLTGLYVTDYMNAQKWYYDVEKQAYPYALLEETGIDKALLPEVKAPGSLVGNITENMARILGISIQTKVVLSSYDAMCSFIGSGVSEAGEASDVSGTVTVFRAVSKEKLDMRSEKIQQIPYYEGKFNIVGGSNNLGGGLIEWLKQCYYQNEAYPYELMEKEAGEVPVGAGGIIFLPYLLGERTPIWDYDARGVFFGLERTHTRKEMTRSVFESTGFIDLDMIAAIEEIGVSISRIYVSGGLARTNLISQIKADITGREIYVLDEFETTAVGAAMMALLGQGEYAGLREAIEKFVYVRMIIRPNQKNHEKYLELYKLYKETYFTLKPMFTKRRALTKRLYGNAKAKIENL